MGPLAASLVSKLRILVALMRKMLLSEAIFSMILILFAAKAQASPVSGLGNGWIFSSLRSTRAYLYTPHAMSWAEAEDFCQMVYGHLATDDSEEELRQFLGSERISGAVWIGLHQSKPQTQFTWTNDFDWSEVSMAPGDGWGEYVEEYEAALCVSLDIDHGFRWDTRYCQGVLVAGTVCQIQVPLWVRDGRCRLQENSENITLRYYPDQELVQWNTEEVKKEKLCSIEDKLVTGDDIVDDQLRSEIEENAINQTKPALEDEVEVVAQNNISLPNNASTGNKKTILNKTSELENLKEDKILQTPVPNLDKDLNNTNRSREKLTVTVKFEVKNNTNLILLQNKGKQMENEKNGKGVENKTDEMNNKNLKESTIDISTSMKSPPAKNAAKSVSTSTISASTSATEASSSSSSSSILLIPSSTPTLSRTETVSSTKVHRIFTKHILNRTQQTSDETKIEISTKKSEFSHFTNVTNLQLTTSVTPILSNLSVEIPPKVSISTDIFNISEVSILAKVNETWPTEKQADGVTVTIHEQTNAPTKIPSRHKRSFQGDNRREEVRINRNNRQRLLRETGGNSFDRKGI